MTVAENKFVSLIYELRENDSQGKVIEVVKEDKPLRFIFGKGQMLPMFEDNIKGLSQDDPFSFALDAKNAYGQFNKDAIADLPIDIFKVDGKVDEKTVVVGNVLPMQDNKGNVFYGKVEEVKDEAVKMDFNHPLAGVNLHFTGKLIEVRDATQEELNPPPPPQGQQ